MQRRYRERREFRTSPYAERRVVRALVAKDKKDWTSVEAHCRAALRILKPKDPNVNIVKVLLRMAGQAN